ncbi:multidrug efflux pump subunit AcrA (membrane-fusion protein) [Bradyrhizobium sp. USDA 4474]
MPKTTSELQPRVDKFQLISAQANTLCSRPAFVQSRRCARRTLSFVYSNSLSPVSKTNKRAASTDLWQPWRRSTVRLTSVGLVNEISSASIASLRRVCAAIRQIEDGHPKRVERGSVMAFRIKHAGMTAGIAAIGVTIGAAWFFTHTGEVRSAKAAAQPAADSDVDIAQQTVGISEKQAAGFRILAAEERNFRVVKNAVGSIDFNQNMLVQAFTTNPGKIVDVVLNVGDTVTKGQTLFTIDSPDLLQSESSLLAAAGVLELQTRTLNRVKQLLKTGGGAQKDVDQATSDQQTAEGNYKAGRDAVRIFGKTDEEIDRILADRKVDSVLRVPSPISGQIVSRSAAPGLYVQPGNAPAPYTLADLSTMWMVANVVETDAPALSARPAGGRHRAGLSERIVSRHRDDARAQHRSRHAPPAGSVRGRRSKPQASCRHAGQLLDRDRRAESVGRRPLRRHRPRG